MTDEHTPPHPEDGFTLVEMLAVMAIIAVLITGAVLTIGPQVDNARVRGTQASMQTLSTAITQYNFTMGNYPETLEDLVQRPRDADRAAKFPLDGFLMSEDVPTDAWGNDFIYNFPGETRSYDLISLGADGEQGGEGSAADLSVWSR